MKTSSYRPVDEKKSKHEKFILRENYFNYSLRERFSEPCNPKYFLKILNFKFMVLKLRCACRRIINIYCCFFFQIFINISKSCFNNIFTNFLHLSLVDNLVDLQFAVCTSFILIAVFKSKALQIKGVDFNSSKPLN